MTPYVGQLNKSKNLHYLNDADTNETFHSITLTLFSAGSTGLVKAQTARALPDP